jgi:nitroreductase
MQLTAWNHGVVSGVFTGIKQAEFKRDFGVPEDLSATIVVGFGYPQKKLRGRKNRRPLSEVAFLERYGNKLDIIRN